MINGPCDCDYFEGAWVEDDEDAGVDEHLCECGHTDGQHKDRTDACLARELDPADWSTSTSEVS